MRTTMAAYRWHSRPQSLMTRVNAAAYGSASDDLPVPSLCAASRTR